MSRPVIEFIIPAFNAAPTLGQTLASLRSQTVANWNAIVVDDGSTDATARIGSSFDPRVRVVSQANRGLAGARNRGVNESTGPLLCFLDADDVVTPDYVARMSRAVGHCDAVTCGWRMLGPDLNDLSWPILPRPQDVHADQMLEFNPFVVGAVVLRRQAVDRLGQHWFDESLPVHEDWELWLRLTRSGLRWAPIVEKTLFGYRLHDNSLTTDVERMWQVGLKITGSPRAWSLRMLARAVAHDNNDLVATILSTLGGLRDDDTEPLAAALRWALAHADRTPPDTADPSWQARVSRFFRIDLRPGLRAWREVAQLLVDSLENGFTPVVYGMGRNGRALVSELTAIFSGPIGWIDDDRRAMAPNVSGHLHRLTRQELSDHHVVLISFERCNEVASFIRDRGIDCFDPQASGLSIRAHDSTSDSTDPARVVRNM